MNEKEIEEIIKKKKEVADQQLVLKTEQLALRKEYIGKRYDRIVKIRQDPLFNAFVGAEYDLSLRLSDETIDKMWYDLHPAWYKSKEPRYRYYIFPISMGKYMQARSSFQCYDVRSYKKCNKRRKIGKFLNRFPRKIIVVYYATSKQFRFYFNIGSMCVRVNPDRLRVFDKFPIVALLKGDKIL